MTKVYFIIEFFLCVTFKHTCLHARLLTR